MNHDDGGEHATYGQYAGGTGVDATSIDTDAMDLLTYPGWGEMDWWDAKLGAGDCLFIPAGWYHYVDSPRPASGEPQLNLGLNLWWQRPEELDEATVDDDGPGGCPALGEPVALSTCGFMEQDMEGVELPTRCGPCYAPRSDGEKPQPPPQQQGQEQGQEQEKKVQRQEGEKPTARGEYREL